MQVVHRAPEGTGITLQAPRRRVRAERDHNPREARAKLSNGNMAPSRPTLIARRETHHSERKQVPHTGALVKRTRDMECSSTVVLRSFGATARGDGTHHSTPGAGHGHGGDVQS